jgi:hypothetical protein
MLLETYKWHCYINIVVLYNCAPNNLAINLGEGCQVKQWKLIKIKILKDYQGGDKLAFKKKLRNEFKENKLELTTNHNKDMKVVAFSSIMCAFITN